MLAMPCPDVLDQFRLVQHHDKVVSPPALHIEKLVDELESATATLTISWDATRPRKSSLAKPRDGVQRSAKTVRFSSSISVKTIPARKPAQRTSTGLDLVTIMKLTDDELLPLAADSQQPDSPASWRHFGRIGWSIERHPSAVLALNVPKPSKMSSEHRSHHYRRGTSKQKGVSPYCCPAFALEYIIATDSGSQHLPERGFSIQRNRGFLSTVHRLTSVYRQSSALGLLHKTNSSNSTLRYRLALSRHTRQLRQRDTARIRGTPLRRRRCQLSTMLRMRRVDKVSRDVHKTKTVVSPSILLHIPSTTRPTSEFEAFVSQRILSTHEQRSDSQALSYNSQPASRTVGNSTSRQLKTYVDHIRNQRGPPKKALDAHHISRSL
ncbi:hypothetical protein CERZMDRAFT_93503 [Cercospora zeae-maydis SCOH1-5]|uniref:Uncharacterized protein n=1 Tax=Cercospora zeae-maydis SCOH1-5 TaxID=717836 RepID=A0A6A6FRU6_9PEZI|nr:hypothetical protein CERZMDRAFT_93503 [Cercospora zeae-maydis SCOH1-5]